MVLWASTRPSGFPNVSQYFPDLGEQFVAGERLGKGVKILDGVLITNPVIFHKSGHDENGQSGTFGPEVVGRHLPRHAVDVRAGDQQIGTHLAQAVSLAAGGAFTRDRLRFLQRMVWLVNSYSCYQPVGPAVWPGITSPKPKASQVMLRKTRSGRTLLVRKVLALLPSAG
jgi:hypothetical protein